MSRGGRRAALGFLAALIVLPAGAAVALWLSLDPATVRTRVIAEVQRASGRQLSVGALSLGLFPNLTIDADDVALANPAGFARPAMMTAQHLRAVIALLPLLSHRVVVRELTLNGADVLLEQKPGQAPNWRFAQPRHSARLPHAAPPAHSTGRLAGLRLTSLTILGVDIDGTLAWQTPQTADQLAISHLRLREVNASSTMSIALHATDAAGPITLAGRLGGQNHLWDAGDRTDWPIDLKLQTPDGFLTVEGTMTDPRALSGYDLAVVAHGPDVAHMLAPVPGWRLPALRDATLATRLVDAPDGLDIPRLVLAAGPSDLTTSIPGLTLRSLAITAPNIDGTNGTQTNHVAADGAYDGQALSIVATLGPVGRLFGRGRSGARSPITLDATALAAGAQIRVQGRIAPGGDWAGTDASLHATVPDLAALTPLLRPTLPREARAGFSLPPLHDLAVDITIATSGGVLSLRSAHLSLPEADIGAEGSARLGGRPSLQGSLHISRLDLDALLADFAHMPVLAAPAPTAPRAPAGTARPAAGWVIPDTRLPFARLAGYDAAITLTADRITYHGVPITALAMRAVLRGDQLDLDPLSATIADAKLSGGLTIDAAHAPPAVAFELSAPGLDVGELASLLGTPGQASGTLTIEAALAANGDTPHSLAATSAGHLGLAWTDGVIANRLLLHGLALVTPVEQLGMALPGGGNTAVACLATRLDLRGGVAVPRAFLLDTTHFRLAAAGSVDLGQETLALRLRPYVRIGGTGLVLPSDADGSWRHPHLALEPPKGAASIAGLANGLLAGLADADTGDCAPALAAARQTPGPIAATPAAAVPPPPPKKSPRARALELLKKLFH
jgi:AsmA protein